MLAIMLPPPETATFTTSKNARGSPLLVLLGVSLRLMVAAAALTPLLLLLLLLLCRPVKHPVWGLKSPLS